MATRKASKTPARKAPAAKAARPAAKKPAAKDTSIPIQHGIPAFTMPDPAQFAKYAKAMTPEQAFDLYKANSKIALEIINAAIENTAKMRRLQFEGEEQARSMQKKAAKHAAEAQDAQGLMAAGQSAAQEAVAQSMQYWGQMFELISDMQKRLFTLMQAQMEGMPGAKEAKAAMAMLPDLGPAKDLVAAMQGVLTSGGSAFESMQKVMGDFTKFAQQSMPGGRR
jgi:hypothetical protein